MNALRLATRGSGLARAQAALAEAELRRHGVERVSTVVVRTQGDRAPDTPVARLRGQGWFTAALERSLLEDRADVAVHSAKDLPSQLDPSLPVVAYLARGDCRDALVTRDGRGVESLPAGARVGTSSPRRSALLRSLRADLQLEPMRGNVDTRLGRLESGEVDALVLACAGLDRLGMAERIACRLDPCLCVPAPCQGAVALQARRDGVGVEACQLCDDPPTRIAATAERAVLAALGGGCLLPLGAWARVEEGRLVLVAALEVDGVVRRAQAAGDPAAPEALGRQVAALLR